ncbi:Endoglucanase 3 [Hordeum vulgare]|nr:Endoglucanase 3 [Hordeum vulgare]
MPSLEGEERVLQEKRFKDLLDAANEQQSLLGPGHAQSVSPGADPRAHRNPSGRDHAEGSSSCRTSGWKGKDSQDMRYLCQSEPTSGRHRRDAGNEGDSVCEVPPPRRREGANATSSQDTLPISARIGPRVPHSDNDARTRLNLLAQSTLLEEDGPIAKPEDWLIDYTAAVGIARGNKRVAIRYVPLMLAGSARTWLNNLPAGSVNSWVDFEEAFVRNFTGTYKRPGRPRELAMCIQRPDEPLRDYVTCWTELRNSCEGVHEMTTLYESFLKGPETIMTLTSDHDYPKILKNMMKHIHLEGDAVYKGYPFMESGVELWYVEVHLHHVKGVCPKTMGQYFFISRVPRAILFDAVREAAMEAIREIEEILEARLRHTQEYLSEVRVEMMGMKLMATMMKQKMDDFKEHLGKFQWN